MFDTKMQVILVVILLKLLLFWPKLSKKSIVTSCNYFVVDRTVQPHQVDHQFLHR